MTRDDFESNLATLMFGQGGQIAQAVAQLGTAATGERMTEAEAVAMMAKIRPE